VNFERFLKSLARVSKTFTLEVGPLRARGVPAVLVAASGLITAVGVARALTRSSDRLPETLREARTLAQSLRPEQPQLHP
jgi:hypothetical protein